MTVLTKVMNLDVLMVGSPITSVWLSGCQNMPSSSVYSKVFYYSCVCLNLSAYLLLCLLVVTV